MKERWASSPPSRGTGFSEAPRLSFDDPKRVVILSERNESKGLSPLLFVPSALVSLSFFALHHEHLGPPLFQVILRASSHALSAGPAPRPLRRSAGRSFPAASLASARRRPPSSS